MHYAYTKIPQSYALPQKDRRTPEHHWNGKPLLIKDYRMMDRRNYDVPSILQPASCRNSHVVFTKQITVRPSTFADKEMRQRSEVACRYHTAGGCGRHLPTC